MKGTDTTERRPRLVKNRDIIPLSRALAVIQNMRAIEEKRRWQRDRLLNVTHKITGLPGGGGVPHGLEAAFAEISELDDEYAEECRMYIRTLREIEAILSGIESETMLAFVTKKYVFGEPNAAIMRDLDMTRIEFERACDRIEEARDMAHVFWPERYILC